MTWWSVAILHNSHGSGKKGRCSPSWAPLAQFIVFGGNLNVLFFGNIIYFHFFSSCFWWENERDILGRNCHVTGKGSKNSRHGQKCFNNAWFIVFRLGKLFKLKIGGVGKDFKLVRTICTPGLTTLDFWFNTYTIFQIKLIDCKCHCFCYFFMLVNTHTHNLIQW